MAKKYKSKALKALHESMQGLHKIGIVDGEVMARFDRSCLVSDKKIKKISGAPRP